MMDKKKLGIALLALPMFVSASVDYSTGTKESQKYIDTFSDYKKYILIREDEETFKKGGFLTREELTLTYQGNKSYLAPGPEYWLKEENATKKYIVDFSAKEAREGHISGVRVTEFVKPKTKVHGKGTQAVPWEFESQYIITAKSSDEAMGKISEYSKVQYIDNGDNVVIQISPVEGYGYAGNSLEGKNTGKITIDNQNITEITLKEIDDSEDVIVYFLPRNDIEYKVNHYYETLETGKYGTAEQEVLKNGTTGEKTQAEAKTKEGFTVKTIEQKKVAGNGSTVVDVYYSRNSYEMAVKQDEVRGLQAAFRGRAQGMECLSEASGL